MKHRDLKKRRRFTEAKTDENIRTEKNGKKLILLIVFFHVLTKQKRSYEKGI